MYQVTITITPWDPKHPFRTQKKITHKGLFVPKAGKCPVSRIKKQVSRRILPSYKELNPELRFRTFVKVLELPKEFLIKEV